MKTILTCIIASIFAIAIDYLQIAFLLLEINAFKWGIDSRFIFMFLAVIYSIVASAASIAYIENKHNNK